LACLQQSPAHVAGLFDRQKAHKLASLSQAIKAGFQRRPAVGAPKKRQHELLSPPHPPLRNGVECQSTPDQSFPGQPIKSFPRADRSCTRSKLVPSSTSTLQVPPGPPTCKGAGEARRAARRLVPCPRAKRGGPGPARPPCVTPRAARRGGRDQGPGRPTPPSRRAGA
jgi:hypothetical protein